MIKLKKIPVWIRSVVLLIIGLVLALGICIFFIAKDPENAANFADNILRPTIGNTATIAIEGLIFGIQDKINNLRGVELSKSDYASGINFVPINNNQTPQPIELPVDIMPLQGFQNKISGEGIWENLAGSGLYTTFIRTDVTRPYAVVNLVYIPLKNISIMAVAGTKHPGGSMGKFGPGKVPQEIQGSGNLIAAFNGGFQEKDGHYGMYVDGVTYSPMQNGLATLFIYKNGTVSIQDFNQNEMTTDVSTARQNGPLLVINGQDSKNDSKGINLWAGTSAGDYITWRSGLGITKDNYLIYAVGPSLTPTSLADALRLAGSINAMQLDINNYWVNFTLFSWNPATNSYSWTPLTKDLSNLGKKYLNGNEKDFFYLYKR